MKKDKLIIGLTKILKQLIKSEQTIDRKASEVHPNYQLSAKNLMRYLILRNYDLRKYHGALSDLGISSLRTAEGYVYGNLLNVIKNLHLLKGISFKSPSNIKPIGYTKSKKIIRKHANNLFNETRKKHFTEIMVTLPSKAAVDKELIRNMVLNGMEIARIDLSTGNRDSWKKMIDLIHEVKEELGQEIKIFMDLSGPKIRTANISIRSKKGKLKNSIPVKVGEHLILTNRKTLGKKSKFGLGNEQIEKAQIGILLKNVIKDVNIGDVLLFDDGMIQSKVVAKKKDEIELVITSCFKNKLGAHKRINLPNTKLNLPALTQKDLEILPFVCEHADIVGYSFVRTAKDVVKLYHELNKNNAKNIGVIFKIENKEAFGNLPEILLAGMKHPNIGVMIARGDLAVDLGFDRISEVQNQILWLCEAAHVPVIWATQVLESLTQTGIPTRAEISDAAQSAQAECVMLNDGPFINEAIKVLKEVLIRMEGHGFKKKNELRTLKVATKFTSKMNKLVPQSISEW